MMAETVALHSREDVEPILGPLLRALNLSYDALPQTICDFSAGYFLADLVMCLRARDWAFVFHHLLGVASSSCGRFDPALFGRYVIPTAWLLGLTESTTVLLYWWKWTKACAGAGNPLAVKLETTSFSLFVGAFWLARPLGIALWYMKMAGLEEIKKGGGVHYGVQICSALLYVLNLAWAGKMTQMWLRYKPAKERRA